MNLTQPIHCIVTAIPPYGACDSAVDEPCEVSDLPRLRRESRRLKVVRDEAYKLGISRTELQRREGRRKE